MVHIIKISCFLTEEEVASCGLEVAQYAGLLARPRAASALHWERCLTSGAKHLRKQGFETWQLEAWLITCAAQEQPARAPSL